MTPLCAAKLTLKGLADRWAGLDAEIQQLDHQLESLVQDAAPRLVASRSWRRNRWSAPGSHRRQPGPAPQRGRFRRVVRSQSGGRFIRAPATTPLESWWQPGRQPGALGDRNV